MLRRLPQTLITLTSVIALSLLMLQTAIAQSQRRALTLRADTQQANAKTGVVTASGNVQLSYPARQI
jgi:lipopolysaccharide export system protein LptA